MRSTSKQSGDAVQQSQKRGERLRYLREEVLRLSRADMENKLGISESSIENWEYARYSGLTQRGAKKIQEACQQIGISCTEQWLLYGTGQRPSSPLSQQLNKAIGNLPDQDEIIGEELNTFHRLNIGTINTVIQDDGMMPSYLVGDLVAGIQHFDLDIEKALDLPCIIRTLDGSVLVRLLKKGTLPNRYLLVCSNPTTTVPQPSLNNVALISASPILWIRRKSKL